MILDLFSKHPDHFLSVRADIAILNDTSCEQGEPGRFGEEDRLHTEDVERAIYHALHLVTTVPYCQESESMPLLQY